MGLTALFEKAATLGSLVRGKSVRLGNKKYRMKGLFANPLAVNAERWQEKEPWLDLIFKSVLHCREGAFLDVGANLGQTRFKILALDSPLYRARTPNRLLSDDAEISGREPHYELQHIASRSV